jgi:ADP-heptose:LPS heptosyltransferase
VDKTKVDAFLKENNLTGRVVLIHPNSGVANRTWPAAAWEALIERFLDDGWSVVLIGSNNNFYSHKKNRRN